MKPNQFSVDGKLALVTGGSRGIGFAIARVLGESMRMRSLGPHISMRPAQPATSETLRESQIGTANAWLNLASLTFL
jgi:hypothetical protein